LQPDVEGRNLLKDRLPKAAGRSGAQQRPGAAHRTGVLGFEGVVLVVVAAVEYERANKVRMMQREHLSGVVTIRVAVHVHLMDAEPLEDAGKVVADGIGAVGVRSAGELVSPSLHGADEIAGTLEAVVALQPRAADGP
jgi:hypothetical protein